MYTVVISLSGEYVHKFQSKYGNAMDEAYLHGQCVDGEVVRVYKEDELVDQVRFCGVLKEDGKWCRESVKG